MNILDAIIDTEFRYCSATGAKIRAFSNVVRVSDDRIPERDVYNYVFVMKDASPEEAEAVVDDELRGSEETGSPHVRIVFHPETLYWQAMKALESLTYSARYIMVLALPCSPEPLPDEHCRMLETRDLEALHEFEYRMYEARGPRYASRQTIIKLDTYTRRKEFDLLLYSIDGQVVGDVELYTDNGIVKLDDFKVHEDYRQRGYGRKLQRLAISRACRNGAFHMYAITDNKGFVKEMYRNDGFVEVGILHTFRK